jgi:hypothetical protein
MLNGWSGVPGIVSGRVVPVLVETDVIYELRISMYEPPGQENEKK